MGLKSAQAFVSLSSAGHIILSHKDISFSPRGEHASLSCSVSSSNIYIGTVEVQTICWPLLLVVKWNVRLCKSHATVIYVHHYHTGIVVVPAHLYSLSTNCLYLIFLIFFIILSLTNK